MYMYIYIYRYYMHIYIYMCISHLHICIYLPADTASSKATSFCRLFVVFLFVLSLVSLRDVKLLTKGFPRIRKYFVPKKRFVRVGERTTCFLDFPQSHDSEKTFTWGQLPSSYLKPGENLVQPAENVSETPLNTK